MALTLAQINYLAKHLERKRYKLKRFSTAEQIASVEAEYLRDMRRLTKEVTEMVRVELIPVLKEYERVYSAPEIQDDFGSDLGNAFSAIQMALEKQEAALEKFAVGVATKFVTRTNRANRVQWVAEFNKLAGIDINNILRDNEIRAELLKKVDENVKLIKTLQPDYFADVKKYVTEGLNRGDDFFSIRERLAQLESKHSRYRPKLIARDQSSKLTGDLNRLRQKDLGIEKYTWRTSKDSAVRDSHKKNDGKVFSWGSPPAGTGHPGQDINCRCTAEPVFTDWINQISKRKSWEPNDPRVLERGDH